MNLSWLNFNRNSVGYSNTRQWLGSVRHRIHTAVTKKYKRTSTNKPQRDACLMSDILVHTSADKLKVCPAFVLQSIEYRLQVKLCLKPFSDVLHLSHLQTTVITVLLKFRRTKCSFLFVKWLKVVIVRLFFLFFFKENCICH